MRIGYLCTLLATLTPAVAIAAPATTETSGFSYAYPPAAARVAPLRAWLEADRKTLYARFAADVREAKRDAKKDGYPYRDWDFQKGWSVVTETPRFLSLSGSLYTYTGGAHGGTGSLALLWDKRAQRRLAPTAVFASSAAIQSAIGRAFCDRLDIERAKRRGGPVKRSSGSTGFDNCPKVSEATLILGSTDRRAIDRIGLLVDQYVAGPYAEGMYEVTLPVTPRLLATVKPDYRAAFAIGR
ncbi:DUF4163 domain-containing protein [Sphingomonas adhaesiva]|uniref:DUF4163 domain-containing protein n=1 Tax=Sphingomonas adhaesiva TaxID=28212 RepID=UPI002FF5DB5A